MAVLQTIQEIVKDGAIVLGASSALFTALSRLPFPPGVTAFFARLGVTTAKFHVAEKEQSK